MSKHILSSRTTLPLCITLHSIPSCENVITACCENVITGSNLNRNKDPHESSTSPRSNKTGHKQTDYFLFCCDPLHVIFQVSTDLEKWIQSCSGNMESRKYQSNQLRNEIAMDIVVFASLRPGWHPSPRRRGGGGILVKYVGKEPILKNHMLVVVTLKEKVLYVIPN